jgi:hypothetical protein
MGPLPERSSQERRGAPVVEVNETCTHAGGMHPIICYLSLHPARIIVVIITAMRCDAISVDPSIDGGHRACSKKRTHVLCMDGEAEA